jgi:hypothetical protein
MSFLNCQGRCKTFKVNFNPHAGITYVNGFVRCVTCKIVFHGDLAKLRGKFNKKICPCCNSQVRQKPRHYTRENKLGIDSRQRVQ